MKTSASPRKYATLDASSTDRTDHELAAQAIRLTGPVEDDSNFEDTVVVPSWTARTSAMTACGRRGGWLWLCVMLLGILVLVILLQGLTIWQLRRELAGVSVEVDRSAATCKHSDEQAEGTHGAVSTTHYLATQAGLEVLRSGGNAYDAAAVVQWVLAVVQPHSTGIAGGCLAVWYDAATNSTHALDGREEAPELFSPTAFCRNPDCVGKSVCPDCQPWPFVDRSTGGHPVGVPGVVRAVERMLADYGTWSFAQTLAPAIRIARQGWPMYPEMRNRILQNKERLALFPATRDLWLPDGGEPLQVGQVQRNNDLADTLQLLAEQGPEVFYAGVLGEDIVSAVRAAVNNATGLAGLMQMTDLAGYRAVYREPIVSQYREHTIVGANLPGGGGVTQALALNMLELYQIGSLSHNQGEYLHRLIDAQDAAFADRSVWLGDADWLDLPLQGLLNKTYAAARARGLFSSLQAARANGALPAGQPAGGNTAALGSAPELPREGTTHFSIADKHRNVISFTTTIESNFGSAVVVPGRGFVLNNELTDFTGAPHDQEGRIYANAPAGGKRARRTAMDRPGAPPDSNSMGGKRPLSSMTPTLVFSKDLGLNPVPELALGSPGGTRIIFTVLQGVVSYVDHAFCPADLIQSPRTIARNQPGVEMEASLYHGDNATINLLKQQRQFDLVATDSINTFLEAVQLLPDATGGYRYYAAADSFRMEVANASCY